MTGLELGRGLLADPALGQRLGAAARAHVAQNFYAPVQSRKLEEVLLQTEK